MVGTGPLLLGLQAVLLTLGKQGREKVGPEAWCHLERMKGKKVALSHLSLSHSCEDRTS